MYDWQFDFLTGEIDRNFEAFWNTNYGGNNNPLDTLTQIKDNPTYALRIRQVVTKAAVALSKDLSPYIWRDFAEVKGTNGSFVDQLIYIVDSPDKPSSKTLSIPFDSFLSQLKNKEVADHLKEVVKVYFKKTPLKVYRIDFETLTVSECFRMQKRSSVPVEVLETLAPLKSAFNVAVSAADADQRKSFGSDDWQNFFNAATAYSTKRYEVSPESDAMLRSVASSWAMGALYPIDFTDNYLTFMTPSEPYINTELHDAVSQSIYDWQECFSKSYACAVNETRLKTIQSAVFNTQAQITQLIERKFLAEMFTRLISKTITIATDKIETMREEVNQAYNTSAGGFGWH